MIKKKRYVLVEWGWQRKAEEDEFLDDLEMQAYEIAIYKILDCIDRNGIEYSLAKYARPRKDPIHGTFESLEEAELKLAIAGWKLKKDKDITSSLPVDAFAELQVLTAFELTSL